MLEGADMLHAAAPALSARFLRGARAADGRTVGRGVVIGLAGSPRAATVVSRVETGNIS